MFDIFQNSVPIELEVLEEIPLDTVIGTVQAVDNDEGENAVIEYAIVGTFCFRRFNTVATVSLSTNTRPIRNCSFSF